VQQAGVNVAVFGVIIVVCDFVNFIGAIGVNNLFIYFCTLKSI